MAHEQVAGEEEDPSASTRGQVGKHDIKTSISRGDDGYQQSRIPRADDQQESSDCAIAHLSHLYVQEDDDGKTRLLVMEA